MNQKINKHSPSPWRLVISDKSWQKKYRIDDSYGACVVAYDDITDENAEANARLIAAAPELLAALEKILNDCPQAGEDAVLSVDGYNTASTAIAKARGDA